VRELKLAAQTVKRSLSSISLVMMKVSALSKMVPKSPIVDKIGPYTALRLLATSFRLGVDLLGIGVFFDIGDIISGCKYSSS